MTAGSNSFVLRRVERDAATLAWAIVASLVLTAPALAGTLDLEVHGARLELPDGWSAVKHANFHTIYSVSASARADLDAEALDQIVRISVHTYRDSYHAASVQRLREIAAEGQASARFLEIGGWPALQRRRLALRPQPGAEPAESEELVWKLTTAVAVDDLVVRLEAWAPSDASEELLATIDGIGASLTASLPVDAAVTEQEVRDLQANPSEGLRVLPKGSSLPPSRGFAAAAAGEASEGTEAGVPAPGISVRVPMGGRSGVESENEIAVSNDGMDIVIGTNGGFFFSNDGGVTWGSSANLGAGPANDPSVAWGPSGGPQGSFYAANIATPSTGFWTSTNGGVSFTGPVAAYTCGQGGDPACGGGAVLFPDQEHIAADRFNVTAGGDQVYSAWRHLDGNWGIVCSTDSGVTWSTLGNFFAGDLPKIGVGQDGFVYVVYHPDDDDDIRLSKFTSCQSNQNPMVRVSDALVVSNPVSVACPVPGLDRCNFRNSLASPMVAVDDTDPNHVYVAYADNTANTSPAPGGPGAWWPGCSDQSLCNENIVVQDSTDGGVTWMPGSPDRTIVISSGGTARRFMPWVCTAGGTAYVTWFDRRAASPGGTTVSNNSLTDFYMGSASLNAFGNLIPGTEMQVNEIGSTDAQCEAGAATGSVASWPAVVDRPSDSEGCSVQPQLGGRCCIPADISASGRCGMPSPASSQMRCDFDQTACPAGELCASNRGRPKYGDYNGNACVGGRFYTTWASATSPPGIPASTDIDTFFARPLNDPPVADAGPDQTVACMSPDGAQVTLDGMGSFDPEGDPLTYTWTNSFGTASGPTPTVTLSPLVNLTGMDTITLEVDDGFLMDTDTVKITVDCICPCFDLPALSQAPLFGSCRAYPAWAAGYTQYLGWPFFSADTWMNYCRFNSPFAPDVSSPITPTEYQFCRQTLFFAAVDGGVNCLVW